MNILEYQEKIKEFAIYPHANTGEFPEVVYLLLGLGSEVGEAQGKWKKLIRDGKFDGEAFVAELGDILWYLTQLTSAAGVRMDKLAEANYNKLAHRKATNNLQGNGDKRGEEALSPDVK